MSAAVSSAGKVIPSLPARTLLAAFARLGALAVSALARSAPALRLALARLGAFAVSALARIALALRLALARLGAFAVFTLARIAPALCLALARLGARSTRFRGGPVFGGRETDTAKKGPEKRKKRLFHKKLLSDKRQRNARILSWYFQGFQSRTKHGVPIRKGNR